jgi:hypothetical protein
MNSSLMSSNVAPAVCAGRRGRTDEERNDELAVTSNGLAAPPGGDGA